MDRTKVVLIGAGSYVFGPSVLDQAILQHRLPNLELALVDLDAEVVELMAGVGRRMARDSGLDTLVTAHTDRTQALAGADYVVCSASPQIWRRFAMDCEIVDRYAPDHLVTEFGGIAGISYSLRQIALIEGIAADMLRLCPDAWLLNVANPLPRVCQAAHEMGVKTAGFCSVSIQGYGMLSRIFADRFADMPVHESYHYPFTAAREAMQATMSGTNHFSWLVDLRDRKTGEDLMPELRRRLAQGATSGHPHSEQIAREMGYLLMPGDDHMRDFVAPTTARKGEGRGAPSHGSPDERQRRLNLMRDIGEGRQPWDELLVHPAWERPVDLIAGLSYGQQERLHSINLINRGQSPQLPQQVFVETACTVTAEGLTPDTVVLPYPITPAIQHTATVTDTIVRAARERSRALLYEAVELDPTILDKRAGAEAVDACLQAHADLLPAYR
jgi:alpha-galactosidase/6-phospho-beta-glucosidase family protein